MTMPPMLPPDAPLEAFIRASLGGAPRTAPVVTMPFTERVQAVQTIIAARTAVNRQWREQPLAQLPSEEQFYVEHAFASTDRAGATLSALQLGILEQFVAGAPIDLATIPGGEPHAVDALVAAWYASRTPSQLLDLIRQVIVGAKTEASRLLAHAPAMQTVGVPERLLTQAIAAAGMSQAALQRLLTLVNAIDVDALASEQLQWRIDTQVEKTRALWSALQQLRDGLAEVTLCGPDDAEARGHVEDGLELVAPACTELTWQADRVVARPPAPALSASPPTTAKETPLRWGRAQSPTATAPAQLPWLQERRS